MAGGGDRRLALERLETEEQMDLSTEILNARAAYFEALDTGEDVRATPAYACCACRERRPQLRTNMSRPCEGADAQQKVYIRVVPRPP